MRPKVIIKAYDGTNTEAVNRINVPAGAVDPNNVLDLGQGVKVYRALLTQTSTNAPVATVLGNTLGGTVVWTYNEVGLYTGTLAGAFTTTKTCLPPVNASASLDGASTFIETSFFRADADSIKLQTAVVDPNGGTITLVNAALTAAYVEILVYPS